MSDYVLQGFSDEFSSILKTSGVLKDVGSRIVHSASNYMVHAPDSVANNAVNTVKAFGQNPMTSMAQGAREMVDFKSHPIMAPLGMASTAVGVNELKQKNDPEGAGRSRLERGTQFAGNTLGGLVGAPFGFTGSMVGSAIGGAAGTLVGKAADKVRGYKSTKQNGANK